MFDAIVRNNTNEANDLIRKIETIESKRGLTPLYVAIQGGRLDVVKVLFDRKDFSVENKDTYPLHLAVQEGKLNIAKFLVDKGADIWAKGNDGRTPLHIAAYSGDLDMVKFFLDKNASIEAKSSDPYKMIGIVESVKKEIINQADTSSNVKRWAELFVEKLRYSIKSVAKEKLKDGMLHNGYSSVNKLASEIYKSDGKLFDDIIKGVINDVYGRVDTKEILGYVRSYNNVDQRISGYVAVFDAMQRNDDLNNSAVFKLAYYVKEVMEMKNYSDVNQEDRSNLEKLKGRLPESVRNAVFASEVCIKNVESERYLYSPNDYKDFQFDSDRRYVFTWPSVGYSGQSWKIEPNGDNVYLKNVEYGRYLYSPNDYEDFQFDSDRRYVFTWPSVGYSGQSWKIEPNGDNVYLKNVQYGRYLYSPIGLCMYHLNQCDWNRRYVFTWSSNLETDQFRWKIESCGSTVRRRRSQIASTNTRDNNGGAFVDGNFNQSIIEPSVCNVSVNGHFGENVDVNAQDVFGRKPIHIAAANNNKNAIELFLSKGVSVDDTDEHGLAPLYYASWYGHLGLVKYLVEKGANINAWGKGGETALDAAIDKKHDDVVNYLKQVELDKKLLMAVQDGDLNKVKSLISQNANVNTTDMYGYTPLHYAACEGRLEVARFLVKEYANSIPKYNNGSTLPRNTFLSNQLHIIDSTLLSLAGLQGRSQIAKFVNAKDVFGRTPLHCAASDGKLGVVKYFVDEEKVDVNLKDNNYWTPLHCASWNGYLDVVEYLIRKGANINAADNSGKRPVHVAAESNIQPLWIEIHRLRESIEC